jgi:xylulokinase
MLLGLDLGTTNVKAVVTDRHGQPQSRGACPVKLFRLPDGGMEQDIEEIWQATLTAIRQAIQPIRSSDIAAVGVSSQGGAMQVLDAGRRPLGRVISWLDQRGQAFDQELTARLGRSWFLDRIAHGGSWLSIGQIRRLQKSQPRLFAPPNQVGFVGDIIVGRLCDHAAHDGTSAGLTLLYNPALRTYDPDLLGELKLEPEQLPLLISPFEPAGRLSTQGASATGLPAGIPVSPAVHDQYASALGTGAVQNGTVMVGTGTAWVLLAVSAAQPAPVNNDTFVCHHIIDGLWGQILSMVNGGSAVSWGLETTGSAGADRARIDDLLTAAPPGSEGLSFWPFMTPFGASGLVQGTKGRLTGLQLSHRSPHIVRAVVEGLAYELNRHLGFLRGAGQQIHQLVMGGGAAASRVTPQLIADVTGLPLRCFAGSEASLVGAGILARALVEPGSSLSQLAEAMLPEAKPVHPGASAAFYREGYQAYLNSLPIAQPITK